MILEKPCKLTTKYRTKNGYGRLGSEKRGTRLEHRYLYMVANGLLELPSDIKICHHCDNPSCIEITHLFAGTALDNSKDMVTKNRQAKLKGSKNPFSKLTEKQILEIRDLYDFDEMSFTDIGRRFNVTPELISQIIRGIRWTHI